MARISESLAVHSHWFLLDSSVRLQRSQLILILRLGCGLREAATGEDERLKIPEMRLFPEPVLCLERVPETKRVSGPFVSP